MLNKLRLDKHQIKLLVLSPRLELDDEALSLIVIGKNNQKQEIKYEYLKTSKSDIRKFEEFFNLENTISEEWVKFSYDDHSNYETKVIYPKELYWVNFLEKGIINNLLKPLKFLRIIPVSNGLLNSKVENYLERK